MAFKSWNNQHLAKFNSSDSSEFLDLYEDAREQRILAVYDDPSHRTVAPSSFRCKRIQWFRLRGVQPDKPKTADVVLDFTAIVGTALHRMVQQTLAAALGDRWVNVEDYVREHCPHLKDCIITLDPESGETQIEIQDPPVRFACDGIIRWKDEYILVEIKSSEFSSWQELTDPKPQHVDQTKCYCSLLGLKRTFFMYIDRQYGGMKCYDCKYAESMLQLVWTDMKEIQELAEYHICPDALPKGDSWCTPAHCKYYVKCAQYGR